MNNNPFADHYVVGMIACHLGMIGDVVKKFELNDCKQFSDNYTAHTSICMHILIIGRLVKDLSLKFKKQHNNIAWHYIILMSNMVLDKCYKRDDMKTIWKFVETDVPPLKELAGKIMEEGLESNPWF